MDRKTKPEVPAALVDYLKRTYDPLLMIRSPNSGETELHAMKGVWNVIDHLDGLSKKQQIGQM